MLPTPSMGPRAPVGRSGSGLCSWSGSCCVSPAASLGRAHGHLWWESVSLPTWPAASSPPPCALPSFRPAASCLGAAVYLPSCRSSVVLESQAPLALCSTVHCVRDCWRGMVTRVQVIWPHWCLEGLMATWGGVCARFCHLLTAVGTWALLLWQPPCLLACSASQLCCQRLHGVGGAGLGGTLLPLTVATALQGVAPPYPRDLGGPSGRLGATSVSSTPA